MESFSNVFVEVNDTACLAVEVPYDADGVNADIVVVHCCPECSMLHSIECLLQVYKYMIEILLMLEISLAQNPEVEYLFSCAASCSESCLLFSNNFFCLGSQPIQYDPKYHFARVTNQAYDAVVIELL